MSIDTLDAPKSPKPVKMNSKASSAKRSTGTGARIGRFAFHSLALGAMVHSYNSLSSLSNRVSVNTEYGGTLQYLTILGLLFTVVTMAFSSLADLFPFVWSLHASKRLFALVSLPVEITISSIYWPLMILAPTLMLPSLDDMAGSSAEPSGALFYIPLWMDLGLHAVPAISLIIDFFVLESKYRPPTSTRTAILLAFIFGSSYAFWAEHCASINGKFPYPFLTIMSGQERGVTYAAATSFALVVFWGLNALHK